MSNNRLWLVHRPTGKAVMLAKRMAVGWYNVRTAERVGEDLDRFFEHCQRESPNQDDFELLMEDAIEAPHITTRDWDYGPVVDGFRTIVFGPK